MTTFTYGNSLSDNKVNASTIMNRYIPYIIYTLPGKIYIICIWSMIRASQNRFFGGKIEQDA